jgi:hypothetical protein
MNDMANGGRKYANDCMMQVSRFFGMRRVVGALRAEEIRLARKLETWSLWWMVVCVAACFTVVSWAIYRIAKY